MHFSLRLLVLTFLVTLAACATAPHRGKLIQKGRASYYGQGLQGKKTANGEKFDMHQLTAAHRTLPFNSQVTVHCRATGKTVHVRINDRGPYAAGRIIDLSFEAARELGMIKTGEAEVELYQE
jgi:rare lipoprotein A